MKLKNWQQTEQNGVSVWTNASIWMRDELRSNGSTPTITTELLCIIGARLLTCEMPYPTNIVKSTDGYTLLLIYVICTI